MSSCKYGYFMTKEETCVYCRSENYGGPGCYECGYELDKSGNETNNIICKDCYSYDKYRYYDYYYYYNDYYYLYNSALNSEGKCYNYKHNRKKQALNLRHIPKKLLPLNQALFF